MSEVDRRSPISSDQPSLQNPSPSFSFAPFSTGDTQQRSTSSSVFDGGVFSTGNCDQQQNFHRHGPGVSSGRHKPRFVKRKQLNGRSGGVSGEDCSGFCNPFRSCNGDLKKFDARKIDLSNRFVFGSYSNLDWSREASSSNVEGFKTEDAGFVFGAKQKQCSENEGDSLNRNDGNLNGDTERRGSSECRVDSGVDASKATSGPQPEFHINSNSNFVFGGNKSNLGSTFDLKMGVSSTNVRNGASDSGFVVGNGVHSSRLNVNNGNKAFSESHGGSAYCSAENAGNNASSRFVFGNSEHSSRLNLSNGYKTSSESHGGSASFSTENAGGKTEHQKVGDVPLKVGSDCDKGSKDNGDVGGFVFGCHGNASSSFFKPLATNCHDDTKTGCETIRNWNSKANAQDGLGSGSSDKSELSFSDKVTSTACASAVDSAFDLPNEIKHLKIDDNKDGVKLTNDSPAKLDTSFVFQSSNKESEYAASNRGDAFREADTNKTDTSVNNDSCNSASSFTGACAFEPSTFQQGMESRFSQAQWDSDLRIPHWDSSSLKESLFTGSNRKLDFSAKTRLQRGKRSKSKGAKLRLPSQQKQHMDNNHVEGKNTDQGTPSSPACYSPMDFSPYQETMAANQVPGEASATSDQFSKHDKIYTTMGSELEEGKVLEKDSNMPREPNGTFHSKECSDDDNSVEVFVFGAKMAGSSVNTNHCSSNNGAGIDNSEKTHRLNAGTNCEGHPDFASCFEDTNRTGFHFSASTSAHNDASTKTRGFRRKYKKKAQGPGVKDLGELSAKLGDYCEANNKVQSSSSSAVSVVEACDTWRLRGNNAYKNGDLPKAEEFYTQGIDSVPCSEISGSCLKPLIVCYSNRAATRMSLGNVRKALSDCAMAVSLDPNFLKVQIRAGNCHLLLGEVELAGKYFNKCASGFSVFLDRKNAIEGADGLQKAQKVIGCINNSAKLLELKTPDAASSALDVIAEAMSISPFSEKLLEMKARCLFMLQNFEEVILLCEKSFSIAEKNFASVSTNDPLSDSQSEDFPFHKLWRWHLIAKSHFYLGRLQVALEFLEKIEQMGSANDMYSSKLKEASISLAISIRDLLHHKDAGNESVRSGKYGEAVEHYTAALSRNVESRPFAAICFCNRAAAYQALGQIADAIADCSLAMALDANYTKAVSRRATLHEMIRDYGQTASDLRRLVSLLEEKSRQSGSSCRSTSGTKEIRQTRKRLSSMEEESKKDIPLDLYLILGVKRSEMASEIKKAYRKAALRHHPDKAGQLLAKSESGIEGRLWKDIMQEVHKDADRLFKMIGESYAVLSDSSKRSEYDIDEEIRKASKENVRNSAFNGSASASASGYYHSPFQRNEYRRNGQGTWKTYGYSHSRW